MPEDYQDKTEEATPRRREEARERGQVARSQDLTAALVVLAAVLLLGAGGKTLYEQMALMTRAIFASMRCDEISVGDMRFQAMRGLLFLGGVLGPFLIMVAIAAVAANILQFGVVFTTHPITPDLSRIDPVTGLQRLFSLRALMSLVMSIGKIMVVGVVVYVTVREEFNRAGPLADCEPGQILAYAGHAAFVLALRAALVLLIIAIFDYAYQHWQYERDLRMTKEELKEELKRMEGDPVIRGRRRAIQRQMAMQRMMRDVPKADVVITNPTHVAVALRYDQDEMLAPEVVAKGLRKMAERIRQIATESGVPIVRRPELARALYDKVEVGHQIPGELFQAVADVIAFVYRKKGREVGVP